MMKLPMSGAWNNPRVIERQASRPRSPAGFVFARLRLHRDETMRGLRVWLARDKSATTPVTCRRHLTRSDKKVRADGKHRGAAQFVLWAASPALHVTTPHVFSLYFFLNLAAFCSQLETCSRFMPVQQRTGGEKKGGCFSSTWLQTFTPPVNSDNQSHNHWFKPFDAHREEISIERFVERHLNKISTNCWKTDTWDVYSCYCNQILKWKMLPGGRFATLRVHLRPGVILNLDCTSTDYLPVALLHFVQLGLWCNCASLRLLRAYQITRSLHFKEVHQFSSKAPNW